MHIALLLYTFSVLTASSLSQAEDFKRCPLDSACLFISRCSTPLPNHENLLKITMSGMELNKFKKDNCDGDLVTASLYILPSSNYEWQLTMNYEPYDHLEDYDLELKFGNYLQSVTINTKDENVKIKLERERETDFYWPGFGESFTVKHSSQKLLDTFANSSIVYFEDGKQIVNETIATFFFERIDLITPCPASQFTDSCNAQNDEKCVSLSISESSVNCDSGADMWLKSNKTTWLNVREITCNETTKEWITKFYSNNLAYSTKQSEWPIEIICTDDNPSNNATASTVVPTEAVPESSTKASEPSSHGTPNLSMLLIPIVFYFNRI